MKKENKMEDESVLVVRDMKAADVEAASEIEREAFSMPWSAEDFLEMVEADYASYYVAELDGEIVGCCGIRRLADEGEITNVAVKNKYRKRKIAFRMMRHMLEHAEENGIGDCTLEVRVGNYPAIKLYESLGFKGEGVRPKFYEKPVEDALIMWKRQEG